LTFGLETEGQASEAAYSRGLLGPVWFSGEFLASSRMAPRRSAAVIWRASPPGTRPAVKSQDGEALVRRGERHDGCARRPAWRV